MENNDACFPTGLLGPVQNLTANQTHTALTLHYKHPPSLAGVPFMYTILILSDDGVTDKEVNTTADEFQFVADDWCPVYVINITSINGVGRGGTSTISVSFMNGGHKRSVYTQLE